MALAKDEVIKEIKTLFIQLIKKHDIKQVYLFGSYAIGNPKDYSDIDIAVVLGHLKESNSSPFDEKFQIFHEAQQYNSLFEVVCFDSDEFSEEKSTLASRIKREGIRII